jgi:hypothetical protein
MLKAAKKAMKVLVDHLSHRQDQVGLVMGIGHGSNKPQ